MSGFADRVADWLDEGQAVRKGLAHEGPKLMERLCITGAMSLREVGRRAELSPTYLSQVLNAKTIVSPEAFIRLAALDTKGNP